MDYLEEHPNQPPPAPGPIRVYLLMDSRLSREALTRVLRRFSDIRVVGQGRQHVSEEVRSAVEASSCDLLVLDTSDLKPFRDFSGTASLEPAKPKILLIGMDGDADQFIAAVRSGVSGYLLKDASAAEIVVAIRALARGEAHCPPQLCSKLFQHIAEQRRIVEPLSSRGITSLTLRQQKLVNMVADGLTNKEIASDLNLSEFTVRNHIHRIMRRLKATNRREVIASVQALDRNRWEPQSAPPCFIAIQHSKIRPLHSVEGSRSKNRQHKGES